MSPVPVLVADADPTPDDTRVVTALAVAARAGDREALAALYVALEPKIARWVCRYRGWSCASWDADDVAQEAYLVLARLVEQWSGDGPFLPYFFACYRFRLRDAVAALDREDRNIVRNIVRTSDETGQPTFVQMLNETTGATFYPSWVETPDPFAGDAFATAELRADLTTLSPADRALLVWRVDEGEPFTEIAERLGVHRRTVHRRWGRVRAELQRVAA